MSYHINLISSSKHEVSSLPIEGREGRRREGIVSDQLGGGFVSDGAGTEYALVKHASFYSTLKY